MCNFNISPFKEICGFRTFLPFVVDVVSLWQLPPVACVQLALCVSLKWPQFYRDNAIELLMNILLVSLRMFEYN